MGKEGKLFSLFVVFSPTSSSCLSLECFCFFNEYSYVLYVFCFNLSFSHAVSHLSLGVVVEYIRLVLAVMTPFVNIIFATFYIIFFSYHLIMIRVVIYAVSTGKLNKFQL